MRDQIVAKVARFPEGPGVYVFLGAGGRALYVGKAANLRARARSYLRPGGDGRPLLRFLEHEAVDVEFLATRTVAEALLLENTVIKKRKPPYNIRLKDDKAFLLLRLDRGEPWPWFRLVRRRLADGAEYFGPYASAKAVRRSLRLLHKIVPLRDCKDGVFHNRSRPCIKHQIGRCPAPCVGLIDAAAYRRRLDDAVAILRGSVAGVVADLERQMGEAAERLEFERAEACKQHILALRAVAERQGVVDQGGTDQDVIGLHRAGTEVTAVVLAFRDGRLEHSARFQLRSELPADLLLGDLLGRYYEGDAYVPGEVVVSESPAEHEAVAAWLTGKRGSTVRILVPRRGPRRAQLAMAMANAELLDASAADQAARARAAVVDLAGLLGAAEPPERIHCMDVSTIQGTSTVASRVCFVDGVPDKSGYRRMRIGAPAAGDDFAAMREAVRRSLALCLDDDADELPELLLVDGGRGQLGAAQAALRDLGLADDVAVAGLAKSRLRGVGDARVESGERLFLPGRAEALPLAAGAPATLLVARIRDEAHRFAVTYHRKVRGRITSELDAIPGVGARRRRALLRHFGSFSAVRAADREALAAVPGIPSALAARIHAALHPGAGQAAEGPPDRARR